MMLASMLASNFKYIYIYIYISILTKFKNIKNKNTSIQI